MKQFYKILITLVAVAFINSSFSQDVHFTADQMEGCAPFTVNFTNNSTIGDSYQWNINMDENAWTFSTTDLSFTFDEPGDYFVQLLAFNSTGDEIGSWNENIKAKGLRMFWTSVGDQVCPGEEVYFDARNWDYEEIFWDLGDGTTADYHNPHHTYTAPGTYTISLIMETSCGIDTVTTDIEVTNAAIPEVGIDVHNGLEYCPNDEIQFFSINTGENYLWDFDDGSTATVKDPIHTYIYPGTKAVSLTITNLCGNSNTATRNLTISANMPAGSDFNIHPMPACPNDIVSFHCHSVGMYSWDFDDGGTSSQKEPQHLFNDTGSYSVELVVINGCGNSSTNTQIVTIQTDPLNTPWVSARFQNVEDGWADTITLCTNEEFFIENESDDESELDFEWHLGDGSYIYDKDLVSSFSTPGMHEITLTVTNNCMGQDSVKKWIFIDPMAMPLAELQTVQDTICPGEMFFFIDNISEADDNTYSYSIWYGDGNFDTNMTNYPNPDMPVFFYEYSTEGIYDYTFTVTNLCGNTLTLDGTVVVDSNPDHSTFYYADNSTLHGEESQGCPGDEVEFMIFGPRLEIRFALVKRYISMQEIGIMKKFSGIWEMEQQQIITTHTILILPQAHIP